MTRGKRMIMETDNQGNKLLGKQMPRERNEKGNKWLGDKLYKK